VIATRLAIVAIIGRRIRISHFDDGNQLCNGSEDGNSTFIDFRFDGISLTSGVRFAGLGAICVAPTTDIPRKFFRNGEHFFGTGVLRRSPRRSCG
jgi:hypothetical protein